MLGNRNGKVGEPSSFHSWMGELDGRNLQIAGVATRISLVRQWARRFPAYCRQTLPYRIK